MRWIDWGQCPKQANMLFPAMRSMKRVVAGFFGLLGGARGPFLAAAAMVMWVLLAVGHRPLVAWRFCWHKSYIIVGIV
jgi:hypothetical protein